MLYQSALGQVSMQADRVRPYQPQVPGAEFAQVRIEIEACVDLRGPRADPLAIHRWWFWSLSVGPRPHPA
jgi:hypothetical protein